MAKVDMLFRQMLEQNGSDLHLEQGQRPKLRVHGALHEIEGQDVLTQEMMGGLLAEIVPSEIWKNFERTGDIDFAYTLGKEARFRANYYRQFYGYGAVFRIIPSRIANLEELDMPKAVKTLSDLHSGLVLVTGPTGSGKSTTLAAIINDINCNKLKKIITIEEPVEFIHENKKSIIVHREVGLDTASFASGLKSAIKSDAGIVLVGEMRDRETVMLALTAAQMGILVFGTLHTNSAAKTIDRIIDVFPMSQKNQVRMIVANTLQAVVSQQLLKSADGKRRWSACEILLRSVALPSILMDGDISKLTTEIQTNKAKGMVLMDDSLGELVKTGRVKKEDAFMKALDKMMFMSKFGAGIKTVPLE